MNTQIRSVETHDTNTHIYSLSKHEMNTQIHSLVVDKRESLRAGENIPSASKIAA